VHQASERTTVAQFMLAVFGRPGDTQALLSAYDPSGTSRALVERVNKEFGRLGRGGTRRETMDAAAAVLRRHGIVGPKAGGWYALRSE
jgi:hypothetical protein